MSGPRVSVLLPVRDGEETLSAALASVRRQTVRDLECVVVVDGGRDRSLAIAREAARVDGRVRVVPRQAEGLVAALGAGLERCRAPVVARMDADDVMHRRRLEAQLAALDADQGLAGVGCHVRIASSRPLSVGMAAYQRWINGLRTPEDVERDAFVECPLVHPTLCLRTHVLRDAGYRDEAVPEDYELVLRLLGEGRRLGVVPRRLLLWRDGPGRLQRTDPRYGRAAFTALKARVLAGGLLAAHDRYLLWGYGDTGRALCRALAEHGKRPSHIVEVHPGRLGQVIAGAAVVPPEALADLAGRPLVVSVAGPDARATIRGRLQALGWRELRDFVCTA